MISKKILALPIIVIAGIAVVFISISQSKDDAVRSLTFGDKIIDLGIQRVDDDYNVRSEIKFKNKNKTKVAVLGMKKPCVCQTVEITPNDSVAPGDEMLLYFAHSKVTNGQGGYFVAPIKIELAIGENKGNMFAVYSGFVIKSSYCKPDNLVFQNMHKGDTSKVQLAYIFLSRLTSINDKLTMLPLQTLKITEKPDNIDVKILSEIQEFDIVKLAPKIVLPDFRHNKKQNPTKTEEELQRFFTDNEFDKEDIWQVFAIAIRAANVEHPIDDFVKFRSELTAIQLPIKVSIMPDLLIRPQNIAFSNAAKSFKAVITVRNTLGQPLSVNKVTADCPQVALSTERVSESEYRVIVNSSADNSTEIDVSSKISIETNIGTYEVKYSIVPL